MDSGELEVGNKAKNAGGVTRRDVFFVALIGCKCFDLPLLDGWF